MIELMTKSIISRIPIGIEAHNQAKKFSLHQANQKKAKQVYLNTLTVWSIKTYINILGWETSLETSDSWNPMLQSLMDVADLDIPNCGKLECRKIQAKTNWINIPAEVWLERIGYIAVELNQSLREASILGFVSQLQEGKIFLAELQSLDELPLYLERQRQRQQLVLSKPVQLSQWLEGVFELSWKQPEQLALPKNTFSFRSSSQLIVSKTDSLTNDAGVTRVKLIEIKSISITNQIALILNIKSQKNQEIEISVKVSPTYICTTLPYGLEIMVLDERENLMMQAQAKETESIEFRFSGEIGEQFSIKVSFHNFTKIETFII